MNKKEALRDLRFISKLLIFIGILALISVVTNSWLGIKETVGIILDLLFGLAMIFVGYKIFVSARILSN